jgi:PAS domain S-box-containing protein
MAEETLRLSEERFRGAFEHAAIGMALVGLDGRFLQVNPSLCRMFGYSERELLDRTFQELTYDEDLDVGLELFADLMSGARDYGWLEKRYVHKDGHVVSTLLSASTVRDAEGEIQYMVSQIQDITQRRRAEERLAEKEAQYRSIFEATRDALIITHPDGHIVEANPAACEMYGYEYDELVNRSLADLVRPEYEGLFAEMIETVRRGGQFSVQATDRRKDGSPLDVEVLISNFTYVGQPHILSVIRDVSERVRARQLLEQRVDERTRELSTLLRVSRDIASNLDLERLLSAVVDRLGEVVAYHAAAIWIATPDGEMVLTGYRGPALQESLSVRSQRQTFQHVHKVIERREPLIIADVGADTPLARSWRRATEAELGHLPEYVASWMGVPLVVKDRVIGMISLGHSQVDYYTAYHAELALAFANQAAVAIDNARLYRRSQRLAVLEERQRIARELHDSVSQALYGIGLGARTARALLDRDPEQAVEPVEYVLSLAEAGLAEMRALIFELRPDALAQEGLVSALGKRAAALHSRYGVEVETALGEEPQLSLDVKEALYRVAQEALNNVIKHAHAQRVVVRLERDEQGILLLVEDDGVGFEPQGEYPGHMGMQTMRERLEEMGGTLAIESAPGRGTRLRAWVHLGGRPGA